jgi:AcrR family transcriptional regulator
MGEVSTEGSSTRHRILQIALTLMSQRGVDGTSMRDLASAAGLNVASLYHYFPSKRELLEAVLVEQGFLPVRTAVNAGDEPTPDGKLTAMLTDILVSMFAVQEFVRLMVGEAIRAEETARNVGQDLFQPFLDSIEKWIEEHRPDIAERCGAPEVARLLSAMVVGIFILHEAGAVDYAGEELQEVLARRAMEATQIISSAVMDSGGATPVAP